MTFSLLGAKPVGIVGNFPVVMPVLYNLSSQACWEAGGGVYSITCNLLTNYSNSLYSILRAHWIIIPGKGARGK